MGPTSIRLNRGRLRTLVISADSIRQRKAVVGYTNPVALSQHFSTDRLAC